MKTICKNCGMAYPVNPEYVGCAVTCPHCGETHTLEESEIIRAQPRRPVAVQEKRGGFDGLGFALGLIFNLLGVLIAAIIGGRRSCVSALFGLFVGSAVAVVVATFLSV